MNGLDNIVSKAIKNVALLDSAEQRASLRRDALNCSMTEWKVKMISKVSGVGFLTGLPGGPAAIPLEAADIAYLLAVTGRACYGIGHIEGRQIDYETDIPIILGIWSGAMNAANEVGVAKVGIKLAGKSVVTVAAPALAKVVGKLVAKSAFKAGGKMAAKVAALTAAKITAKMAAKVSTKWIPILGGFTSAAINGWVMDGILDAATGFYQKNYVVFTDEMADDVLSEDGIS